MAKKILIVELEEGMTKCHECPDYLSCSTQHCTKYDFSTIKVRELQSNSIVEFASNYSRKIWEKLMSRFKIDPKFWIGTNDVSDYVLNAITDTYNHIISKPDDSIHDKHTTETESHNSNNTNH